MWDESLKDDQKRNDYGHPVFGEFNPQNN